MAVCEVIVETEFPSSLFAQCMIDTPLKSAGKPAPTFPSRTPAINSVRSTPEIRPEEDCERWDGLS